MKDASLVVRPPAEYNTLYHCQRKCKYNLKRRALKDAHVLAEDNPTMIFTVYECQWCKGYHIGSVRTE